MKEAAEGKEQPRWGSVGKVVAVVIALQADGVASAEVSGLLERAYSEMRHLRTADRVGETLVAWNEGFFRGALEVAALVTGCSPDELVEWLRARFVDHSHPELGARVCLTQHGLSR